MGCTEQKISTPSESDHRDRNSKKKRRNDDEEPLEYQIPVTYDRDDGNNRTNANHKKKKEPHKDKIRDQEPDEKRQKQNMKVRKAKQIQSKPEHDKFINDIVGHSKSKSGLNFPHMEHSLSGCGKPVVQYTENKNNGSILANEGRKKHKSHWNDPIADVRKQREREYKTEMGESYVEINEKPKSPMKKKEIQKRLNDIRNGKIVQNVNPNEFEAFQSSKTMHL